MVLKLTLSINYMIATLHNVACVLIANYEQFSYVQTLFTLRLVAKSPTG